MKKSKSKDTQSERFDIAFAEIKKLLKHTGRFGLSEGERPAKNLKDYYDRKPIQDKIKGPIKISKMLNRDESIFLSNVKYILATGRHGVPSLQFGSDIGFEVEGNVLEKNLKDEFFNSHGIYLSIEFEWANASYILYGWIKSFQPIGDNKVMVKLCGWRIVGAIIDGVMDVNEKYKDFF